MGIAAFGTLLKMGDGAATEVFTTIAEVTDISGPALKAKIEEITSHSSTGGYVEKIPTNLNAGAVKVEINYLPTAATHALASGLLGAFHNKTKKNWKLVFPDTGATTWSFSGYVAAFEPKEPVDGKLSASLEIEITGQPTLA